MVFSRLKIDIVILIFSNLMIGLIEFVFNLYLAKVFGPEGLGLISLVTPVYCVFLSFITEGIVITVSKIISRLNYYRQMDEMQATMHTALLANFLWGSVVAVLMYTSAGWIATFFLHDPTLAAPIRATCPLTVLMALTNVLKGYFLGRNKVKVPAFINMAEKLFRFPVLYLIIRASVAGGIAQVYMCYSIGESLSVLLLFLYEKLTRPGSSGNGQREFIPDKAFRLGATKKLFSRAAPICLTNCLLEFTGALSQIIVKSRLLATGFSYSESLALLGKFRGMVFPLMMYPMIIVGSVVTVMVPRLSTIIGTGNKEYARIIIAKILGIALVIGVSFGFIFFFFADAMGIAIYERSDLCLMLKLSAFLAPILYTSGATTSVLISMGKEKLSFRNSFFQQCILISGLALFTGIPRLNIYGYILSMGISYLFLLIINLIEIRRF